MLRRRCKLILVLAFALSFSSLAFASSSTKISVAGAETQLPSGAWDSGTISILLSDSNGNTYSETAAYGQFSTSASIASAFGAMFSNSYLSAGLCAYASGGSISFYLSGPATLNLPVVTSSSTSFYISLAAWQSTPTLNVVSSRASSTYGDPVTFTAVISSGPTGTITFYDGGTSMGTGTISGITAHFTTNSLSAGNHTITAEWVGNTNYSAVTSSPITQTVKRATPTLSVATSQSLSGNGVPVAFTATLSSGPTGSVSFYDGNVLIGTGSINSTSSTATISAATLAPGTHSMTASWGGSTNFAAVTSSAISQIVEEIAMPGTGNINTLAGSGTPLAATSGSEANEGYPASTNAEDGSFSMTGSLGDGELATNADILYPTGIAVDSVGDVYFSDVCEISVANPPTVTVLGCIRKVSASTGDISTVAGNGAGCSQETDSLGDGCPAQQAIINYYPAGVALDSSGNIYLADDNRVRKISVSNGLISVIAGNGTNSYPGDGAQATNAGIMPGSLAVDLDDNVYLMDYNGGSCCEVIRKVAPSGTITTVAGNGNQGFSGDDVPATAAELNNVNGIAVDAFGNLYIGDAGNCRVRAVYSSGSLPNVSNPTVGYIYTVAGNGTCSYGGDGGSAISAQLTAPVGIAADQSGDLYLLDSGRVREVSAAGTISTVAGNGVAGFSGDGGSAISAKIHLVGYNYPGCCNTSTSMDVGIATDASGNLFFSDSLNYRIRAVGSPNRAPSSISVSCSPNSIAYGAASVCAVSVAGGATGTVSLTYNGTAWTTLSLVSGAASATWSSAFGAGVFTIGAIYNGDGSHPAATATTTLTVTAVAPTASLTSSVNPIQTGGSTVFTVTLTDAVNPTGTIAFLLNGSTLGMVQVDTGSATYTATNVTWAPGLYTITAIYSGDADNAGATWTIVETVNPALQSGSASLTPTSGPPTSSVTISGSGFGTTQGSSTVTFNQTPASVTSWSTTSIVVTVPASLVAGPYTVAITVNNSVVGQGSYLVVPLITGLSLSSGPPTMGLLVLGYGFGSTQGIVTLNSGQPPPKATIIPNTWGSQPVAGSWGTQTTNNQTTITIQIPEGTPQGAAQIIVGVPYGTSGSNTSSSAPMAFQVTCTFLNNCNPTPP